MTKSSVESTLVYLGIPCLSKHHRSPWYMVPSFANNTWDVWEIAMRGGFNCFTDAMGGRAALT